MSKYSGNSHQLLAEKILFLNLTFTLFEYVFMQMTDALELWNQLFLEQDDAIKTELIACIPFTQHKSVRLITARREHSFLIFKTTIGIGTN